MLRDARKAGLVTLLRSIQHIGQRRLWAVLIVKSRKARQNAA
jgi:hypothetical protein